VRELEHWIQEERAKVAVEYGRVLASSVKFEKRIRNRWREKNQEKNRRIAELERRVAELENRLRRCVDDREERVLDRDAKERKLVALMMNDLGMSDVEEKDMVRMNKEVGALEEDELNGMLASRLGLEAPVDEATLEEKLAFVDEPERSSASGPDGFTGAPDMSHEARPEERK
jgi:hypothetical protein